MSDNIENNFPLYDHLYERVSKMIEQDPSQEDIKMNEVRELIEGFRDLDQKAKSYVFLICRIHSLRHSESKLFDVPYGGEKINKSLTDENICDVKFDIRTFPPMLRRMLLEMVRMDKNLQKEKLLK
jgi:hypothetical protein